MVRAFRIGLWTLAIIAVLGLIQHAVSDVVIVMFRTSGVSDTDEWQRFFHANSIAGWVHDALIVAAAIACAVASDGLRRTWFGLLAAGTAGSVLLILAPWLASFVKEPSFAITMWSWRASAAASAFAAVSFAIAAQQSSTNKRLTDALMIATAGRF